MSRLIRGIEIEVGNDEMKWLLATAVFAFPVDSAIAGLCHPSAYAKLQDMPSERLVSIYCTYAKLVSFEREAVRRLNQLVLESSQKGLPSSSSTLTSANKDIAEHDASISECFDQQAKINSVLKNRSEPADPSCESK
jgi:hypothetical protein